MRKTSKKTNQINVLKFYSHLSCTGSILTVKLH